MLSASSQGRAPFARAAFARWVKPMCWLVLFARTASAPVVSAQSSDELLGLCRTDSLPADIRGTLERRFTGWKIQEPTDLGTAARERWAAERPLTCPGVAG